MLVIHHMGVSQSERIVFLCEELGIEYKLVKHNREPMLSPQSLKSIPGNQTGKAPFIEDTEAGITLSESGAIVDYILAKNAHDKLGGYRGENNLDKKYGEKGFVDYVYWFHFANAGLQSAMSTAMLLSFTKAEEGDQMKSFGMQRLHGALKHIDERLRGNKWLAGDDFTAADVMTVYSLTTQRYWTPGVSYMDFPNILRYLGDVSKRPGYQSTMKKGDPEMELLLGAEAPPKSLIQLGGIDNDAWKKK